MVVVDWSQLSADLLMRIIENHLISMEDFVMFSCVCSSWYSAAYACDISKLRNQWTRQMPWLMLTDGNDDDVYSDSDNVYEHFPRENNFVERAYFDETTTTMSVDDIGDAVEVIDDDWHDNRAQDIDVTIIAGDASFAMQDEQGSDKKDCLMLESQRYVLNLQRNRETYYRLSLPELYGRVCWGSPYGWIVTLGMDRHIELFNPLTKATLPLPSQDACRCPWKEARGRTIRTFSIAKAVLLRSNTTATTQVTAKAHHGSFMVVIFHCDWTLCSIAKPGDSLWRPIFLERTIHTRMADVLYDNSMQFLLFVDFRGHLHYCYVSDTKEPLILKPYAQGPPGIEPLVMTYLYIVRCSSDLLLITRARTEAFASPNPRKTTNFKVYKLDFSTKDWEELQDLNGHSLFVGNSTTFCVPAHYAVSRSNCIYFNDDDRLICTMIGRKAGGYDGGVFDLTERSFHQIPNDGISCKSSYCCPLWFSPAL